MSSAPVVSVLMTAYNRERYIGTAIESVLKSTYEDFELIIADDASTDSTSHIAARYAGDDSRIRVYVNERNLGDYPNRNRAASYARGRYLKYVDSDDAIYPHGLEVMVRSMESHPSAPLGLSALAGPDRPHPRLFSPVDAYRQHFFVDDLLARAPGSVIIRKTAFDAVGGFSGQRQIGDFELWLRLAARFDVVTMPCDLVWDRIHHDQQQNMESTATKDAMRFEVAHRAIESDDCPLPPAERLRAIQCLCDHRSRSFWTLLMRPRGLRNARRYQTQARLPFVDAASYLRRRLFR